MENKQKILISIGVLVIVAVVFVAVIVFRQQKQISTLTSELTVDTLSKIKNEKETKALAEKASSDYVSNVAKEKRETYIKNKRSIYGIVSKIDSDKIFLNANIPDINDINKADFSGVDKPIIATVSKEYTVSITDKTKIDKKAGVGDLVNISSDKSVLEVDSFEATEVMIEKTAEELKKEQEVETATEESTE